MFGESVLTTLVSNSHRLFFFLPCISPCRFDVTVKEHVYCFVNAGHCIPELPTEDYFGRREFRGRVRGVAFDQDGSEEFFSVKLSILVNVGLDEPLG